MDHAARNSPHTDAMQLFVEPKSALIAALLTAHLKRPHVQSDWCLSMNVHYTVPSLPCNIKGKLNLKVVIFTSHFLDFEHLIEHLQLCLFHLACIISKRTPLSRLTTYLPLITASTRLLLSTRTRVRSLVPGIYTYSG